jgi:hypothetical protein
MSDRIYCSGKIASGSQATYIHFVGGDNNWRKALDVLAFSKLNIIFNI